MSSERGGATMVVSDQDIAQALQSLLRESNPNSTTLTSLNAVVQQLESKLGLNLSHKVDFIRNQIQFLFRLPPQNFPIHRSHQQYQQPPQQLQSHQQPQQQQQQQQRGPAEHFALHQNPNFHPAVSSSQLPPNFSAHRPEDFVFRQAAQPSPPPQPVVVAKTEGYALPAVANTEAYALPGAKTEAYVGDVTTTSGAPPAPGPGPVPVPAAEVSKESVQPAKKKRGGPGGLNKLCGVSPQLEAVVGHPQLPRTEIVKQLWAYIRKNNLQDPSNKRKIICNDELRLLFEVDCTDMFKMNKLLAKHIIPLEPTKPTGRAPKKSKVEKESSVSRSTESVPIVVISEALANFFATGEREMAQGEVLRRVWEYIKVNQLEDPVNAMVILCDAKLQELLGCESISALGIPEMLARHHLFKRS